MRLTEGNEENDSTRSGARDVPARSSPSSKQDPQVSARAALVEPAADRDVPRSRGSIKIIPNRVAWFEQIGILQVSG